MTREAGAWFWGCGCLWSHSFFQVGLVSWGLYNPCGRSEEKPRRRAPSGKVPPPRDFHISLFRLQPWLRQHLEGVLNFLPL